MLCNNTTFGLSVEIHIHFVVTSGVFSSVLIVLCCTEGLFLCYM